jgi:hypothetical protein
VPLDAALLLQLQVGSMERYQVHRALCEAMAWMKSNGLAGYDPYDALASPLASVVGLRIPFAGRLFIQGLRLFPLNLRRMLRIAPALDSKALGLLARAYLLEWDRTGSEVYRQSALECLRLLRDGVVAGFSGACWAHPFPYLSSRSHLNKGFPTVVSTVHAALAFLDGYERIGNEQWLEMGRSACDFILTDLARIGGKEFFFSYYPGQELAVHNANLLAAGLLARVARLTDEGGLLRPVQAALRYTLADQQPDGSWPYDGPGSVCRADTFVDGFHTGFVLESLWDISQDAAVDLEEPITRGLHFYLEHLFQPLGQPRRMVNRRWPVDVRDCAQAMIVLARLRGLDPRAEGMLEQVAAWTICKMQAPEGYFYHLRWRWYVPPIPYVRFQGWMLMALARYLEASA